MSNGGRRSHRGTPETRGGRSRGGRASTTFGVSLASATSQTKHKRNEANQSAEECEERDHRVGEGHVATLIRDKRVLNNHHRHKCSHVDDQEGYQEAAKHLKEHDEETPKINKISSRQ